MTAPSDDRLYSIQVGTENLNAPDDFEPDDTFEKANFIISRDGGTQFHNFHAMNDVDWVKFLAVNGKTITIKATVGTASDINLALEIYDREGTNRLETVNENEIGEGELFLFIPDNDGIYYLKVTDVDPQMLRLNTEYELTVFYETGDLNGYPQGFVIDSTTNKPLSDFRVKVYNDNATFWDNHFSCLDFQIVCDGYNDVCGKYDTPGFLEDDYKMEVSSPGYEDETVTVKLEANKVTCQNFTLKPVNSLPPDRVFSITVNDSYNLKFGQTPDATEGFDPLYDKIYTPSDGSIADVYLFSKRIPDPTQQILVSDFRPVEDTTRWRLQLVVPDGGNQPVELRWEQAALNNDYRIYLQELNGELPINSPVDMTESTSLSVLSNSSFEIVYSQLIHEGLTIDPRWNLCSIPVMTLTTVDELASEEKGLSGINWRSIWYWDDDRYKIMPVGFPLNPERGYWIMNTGDTFSTNDFVGIIADGYVRLNKGWNLVAPVEECPRPQKSEIIGHIWSWDSELQRYNVVGENEMLSIGHGYWIYANEACEVNLNSAGHKNSQN